jgi:hypothetical protein
MSDRRKFFKQAGALAAVPLSAVVLPQAESTIAFVQTTPRDASKNGIVIENAEMRLLIGQNAQALSLVHKASGQECLAANAEVPMFTVTQYRPYDNELQLAYPAKVTQFPGQSVRREGDFIGKSRAFLDYPQYWLRSTLVYENGPERFFPDGLLGGCGRHEIGNGQGVSRGDGWPVPL